MAKIVLTISADNKATQSVKLLNAEVQTLSKTLSTIKVNKNLTAQINALTKHYTAIANAQSKITANANKQAIADEKLRQQQARSAAESVKLATAQVRLEKAQRKTTSSTELLQKRFANLISTIKSLKNAYPQGTFDSIEQSVRENLKAAQDGTKSIDDLGQAYNELSRDLAVTKAETDKVTTAVVKSGDSIGSLAKKFFLWQITATLVMKPLRLISDALTSINETLVKTEDTVIALQRVLPSGSASDSEISSQLYRIAEEYGQTFENVSQIAENFARTGMSWEDTIKATEAAIVALNVAELDAEEATTGMIAILSQFSLEASDLETVIDKLNKTADNFPVTTEKILAALQRTGSAASNANLSLDETISLITALSKATGRSGENIGTALNSLIQYSSKESALDTFAGLSDESAKVVANYRKGAATILDVWRQVSKEIQSLDERQADLLDAYFTTDDGTALSEALDGELEDIYTELGGVYDTANTFRKNYFIALLGNMDTVDQALGTLTDAAGYSQTENEKYLDTYTAKLNSLQAKWQEVANDEQGLLGIKKDLVDLGSGLLDIIQGIGGLKTALIALGVIVGTIVATTKGAQIVAGLQLIGKTIKSLTIDAMPNFIATLRAWRGQTTLLNGQVVTLTESTATFGQVLKASLPIVTMLIVAISALDSAIRRSIEEREEVEKEAIEQQNEAIKKSNERLEAQKKEVAQMEELASSVENLRKILDDSSQSEDKKANAQDELLHIQNTLIESNNAYKDSLDLTNGSLEEQLGLIEKLTTEQLKKKANDFLESNKSEIEIANNRLESISTTNTDMLFSGEGWDRGDFRDIINSAISGAGVGDIASINEDNTYGALHNYGKRVSEGFKKGFWEGMGELTGFGTVFDKASYVGEANAGFSFSGTVEQQIEAITKLRDYIATNKDTLDLSSEEVVAITTELNNQLSALNSEEYKQAQLLAEKAKATQDWLNGTISEADYLKIVYNIEKDISKETGNQTNDISKVTGAYDDLIKKLEELRDLQKESAEWEEKKLAVLEAEKALENARNEATVRRFNESTGQWEWQTDEKAIAEAEENLEEARLNLEESAYNTIIDQLKQQKENSDKVIVTNESILAILKEVTPLLGEDFANAVKGAISGTTGVDLNKPVKSYDSGGIANGLGFMPKATAQPESVNDPELTKKILTPVSNAEFDRYVKDMGIMFAQARDYARAPQFERVNNTTDNRIDNSGQTILNGVTIGSDRRGNTLDELLTLFNIIPKN